MEDLEGQKSPLITEQYFCRLHSPARFDNFGQENIYDVDPDLMVEIDIPLDGLNSPRTKSGFRLSNISKSDRGQPSKSKSQQGESSTPIKTRGRPIKPHEMEPFLSIDNISPEKLKAERDAHSSPTKRKFKSATAVGRGHLYSGRATASRATSRNSIPTPYTPTFQLRPKRTADTNISKRSSTAKIYSPLYSSGENSTYYSELHVSATDPSSYIESSCTSALSEGSRSRNGRVTPSSPFISPNDAPKKPNFHVKKPFKHSVKSPRSMSENKGTSPSADLKEKTAFASFQMAKVLAKEQIPPSKKTTGKLLKGRLKPLKPVLVEGPSIQQCRGIVSDTRFNTSMGNRTLERRKELVQAIPNIHEYLYDRPRTVESIHRTSEASSIDENHDNVKGVFSEEDLVERLERLTPSPVDEYLPVNPPASADSAKLEPGEVSPSMQMFLSQIHQENSSNTIQQHSNINGNNISNNISYTEDPSSQQKPASVQTLTLSERPNTAGKSVRFAESNAEEGKDTEKKKKFVASSCKEDSGNSIRKKDEDPDGDHDRGSKSREVPSEGTQNTNLQQAESKSDQKNKGMGNFGGTTDSEFVERLLTDVKTGKKEVTKLCCRSSCQSDPNTPNMLQVQTVFHAGKTTTILGPESPRRRSRTPSPTGKRINSASSPPRKSMDGKSDKMNKLVRPSSANMEGRKRRERKETVLADKQEQSCLRKSKVYFEGELPPRESIFTTKIVDNQEVINIVQHRDITFDDIDAELSALRVDIQETNERLLNQEEAEDLEEDPSTTSASEDSDAESTVRHNQATPLAKEDDEPEKYIQLLEMYRQMCMSVSETCGEFSTARMTPRKSKVLDNDVETCHRSKPNSTQRRSRPSSAATLKGAHDSTGRSSSMSHNEKRQTNLNRTMSDLTLSDSGVSELGSVSSIPKFVSRPQSANNSRYKSAHYQCDKTVQDNHDSVSYNVPKLDLSNHGSERSTNDVFKKDNEGESLIFKDCESERKEGKTLDSTALLALVCEELKHLQDKEKGKVENQSDECTVEEQTEALQLVAEKKKLNKIKKKTLQKTNFSAPFPPVCFNVNAKPPKGYLYYFAYGTDMNLDRLSTFLKRTPDRYWGVLFGFQLVFNKRGADIEAGGFPNIEFNPYSSTEGVVYLVTLPELELLDKHVGYPDHFLHLMVPVWMMNSHDSPEDYGIAQYCVPAMTFISQDKWIVKDKKLNCSFSLSQCLKSSNMLSPEYRSHLSNLVAMESVST